MVKFNRVTISVPPDVDLEFRKRASLKNGFQRGWYGKSVVEAFKIWVMLEDSLKESNGEVMVNETILGNIRGILKVDERIKKAAMEE